MKQILESTRYQSTILRRIAIVKRERIRKNYPIKGYWNGVDSLIPFYYTVSHFQPNEDNMNVSGTVNYDKMELSLYIDEELIKTFNINKGQVGQFIDYFMLVPVGGDNKLKYHIVVEFLSKYGNAYNNPLLYIYPIYGKHSFSGSPVALQTEGLYSTYLSNHKNNKTDE